MLCHLCDSETDFICDDCGEPVCDDCCVVMTIHNQIDYPLCTSCHEGNEADRSLAAHKEYLREESIKAKKEKRNAAARANYRKPENVAKRKTAREKRKAELKALRKKQWEEAVKFANDMFRGMWR